MFRPGRIHKHRLLWEEYLHSAIMGDDFLRKPRVRRVFELLQHGVEPDWVPPLDSTVPRHPKWEDRATSLRAILLRHYNPAVVDTLTLRTSPGRLPNLSSTWSTTTSSPNKSSIISVPTESRNGYGPDGEPLQCILPFGVDYGPNFGKYCTIYDARYPNTWHL